MWSLENGMLIAPDGTPLIAEFPESASRLAGNEGIFIEMTGAGSSPRRSVLVGRPLAERLTALYRSDPFWMRPAVCNTGAAIPPETQVLFAELADGRVALFVPLMSPAARSSLKGWSGGGLTLVAETGNLEISVDRAVLFVAVQKRGETDLSGFLARCAAAVAKTSGVPTREERRLPEFMDRLGWCTWDAFYKEVSAEKVLAGLASMRAAGISPGFVILDDGWQATGRTGPDATERLASFEANDKFPGGLAPLVRAARTDFGVRHFLVWHTAQGYWGGVDANAFATYEPAEMRRAFSPGVLHHFPEANDKWWGSSAGVIPPAEIGRFFDDYHVALAALGVDGVKVDHQAGLEAFAPSGKEGRVGLYAAYRSALERSVHRHFGGKVLHCMGCVNDLLYQHGDSVLTRTSDDFWPHRPETHGMHLWTNALVALWFGHFVHPDWDMFQSVLPSPHEKWPEFHAAARAICGGPIYVSDAPGRYDAGLIRKLIGADGTILRCPGPATIAWESLFRDVCAGDAALKIVNTVQAGGDCADAPPRGVVGVFNCHFSTNNTPALTAAEISPKDCPQVGGFERYAVLLHRRLELLTLAANEATPVSLGQADYELATISPIQDGLALIGLLEKFNSASSAYICERTSQSLTIEVRDAGTLAIYSEREPELIEPPEYKMHYARPWITIDMLGAGRMTVRFQDGI